MRRIVLLLALSLTLAAQPSPEAFLGYPVGDRFTRHHRIVAYFEELDRQSPKMSLERIGETWEGRPLIVAAITSEANQAALESIRSNVARIASGEEGAETLAAGTPAIVWLGFGIHGNESSSAEAAMMVAHSLLTDPAVQPLLERLVILIDPLQNPDGRERYIQSFQSARGVRAHPDPDAAEHFESWPGGRFNHYLIDMNRDWAWQSQIETRVRTAAYRRWNPQVFVDFHEMGFSSSYFFPPSAKPVNANLHADIEQWLDVFGRANAAEFSKRGWAFFVGENFDLFYPAYGDSWPSLRGAVGMTYEQAGGGRAGTAVRREDGTVLTLADRALHHFTTAMTTVNTAARNREALLRYTHQAARTQIEQGRRTFLILPGSPGFEPLVELLIANGIGVETIDVAVSLRATRVDRDVTETRSFPQGTAVVSTRQPLGRLAASLLERTPALHSGFVDEQRERAAADQPDEFYDLTAWSLPLAMNVEAWETTAPLSAARPYSAAADAPFTAAPYGYAVDGLDANLYRFLGRLIAGEVNFSVANSDVELGTLKLPRGSAIVLKNNNPADLDALIAAAAREAGVTVLPIASGWSGGTAIGSQKITWVRRPRIGLVGGAGSSPTSFGMLWFTLDVDTAIPHTPLVSETIRNLDLDDYDVLVFPDGNYASRLGDAGVQKVRQWVRDGGVIVAVKGASSFLREKDVEMSKLKLWEPPKKKDDDAAPSERYNDYRVPGSAFRTVMNERSYLTLSVPRPPAVLVEGSDAFLPLAHAVDNVLRLDAKDPLISGIAWDESLERLKGAVYVARESFGRGQVITFADDPHFRLFWRGTLPIFMNAILYSTTFSR